MNRPAHKDIADALVLIDFGAVKLKTSIATTILSSGEQHAAGWFEVHGAKYGQHTYDIVEMCREAMQSELPPLGFTYLEGDRAWIRLEDLHVRELRAGELNEEGVKRAGWKSCLILSGVTAPGLDGEVTIPLRTSAREVVTLMAGRDRSVRSRVLMTRQSSGPR